MMEKMTYVMALDAAVNCEALSPEVREKLAALKTQQEKRNSGEKKPTKTQRENVSLRERVVEVMATLSKPMTATELMAAEGMVDADGKRFSNQKMTSLLRTLVSEGKVVRTEEKHKAYFEVVRS